MNFDLENHRVVSLGCLEVHHLVVSIAMLLAFSFLFLFLFFVFSLKAK